MGKIVVITHPEVVVDPDQPVTDWGLSETGRRRASVFAKSQFMRDVTRVWCSTEQKARDTAAILARPRGLPIQEAPELGENDRSATGFLPPDAFEAAADAFFAQPERSFRGWERAVDAQSRIHKTVQEIVLDHKSGDLAIVTHGAVGTLLWSLLAEHPIHRRHDQPSQGHFWTADLSSLVPDHGWRPIA